jgi:hypothetical protein
MKLYTPIITGIVLKRIDTLEISSHAINKLAMLIALNHDTTLIYWSDWGLS